MSELTHLNSEGQVSMVDVSEKTPTRREASCCGRIWLSTATMARLKKGDTPKGDLWATARLAGIMAAKQTQLLIPLCHQIPLEKVGVEFAYFEEGVVVRALARTTGKTGVEMEALVAAQIALATLFDMLKAIDKSMVISDVHVVHKDGGRSANYMREHELFVLPLDGDWF